MIRSVCTVKLCQYLSMHHEAVLQGVRFMLCYELLARTSAQLVQIFLWCSGDFWNLKIVTKNCKTCQSHFSLLSASCVLGAHALSFQLENARVLPPDDVVSHGSVHSKSSRLLSPKREQQTANDLAFAAISPSVCYMSSTELCFVSWKENERKNGVFFSKNGGRKLRNFVNCCHNCSICKSFCSVLEWVPSSVAFSWRRNQCKCVSRSKQQHVVPSHLTNPRHSEKLNICTVVPA